MLRTPLFAAHKQLGGRLIEFGGWEMPVQYTSIVDEHLAVRKAAGLFDISHMGEVDITGNSALEFLNRTLTNDARKLAVGEGQYTLMCNENGGVIDDLYLYRIGEQHFLLIINASRIQPDVQWLERQLAGFEKRDHVSLQNVSDRFGAVAVQGPKVTEFIDQALPGVSESGMRVPSVSLLKKNQIGGFHFGKETVYVARTGYTGEIGFEIVAPNESLVPIWERLLAVGKASGLQPAGLGARDTLRTEMGYPLYGHELDEQTTPIEAGVGFFVSLDKGDFAGRSILAAQKAGDLKKKLIAFKMTDRSAPPRPHYPIWSSGSDARKVGEVVSGTQSPSLGVGIGLGYVPPEFSKTGTTVEIEIRGRRAPALVASKPFYKPNEN